MHCKSLVLLSGLVPALAAVTTVVVESTVFYCPCTSSTLASGSSSLSGSSIASLSPSGISTSTPISQSSVTPTTVVSSPGTTISKSTAPTSTAPGACIPLNGDCSNATFDYGCCSGSTCDVVINICVAEDSSPTVVPPPATTAPTATSTSPSSPTSTAPGTCIAQNADCSNQTIDYFCCPGLTCDVAINTCVPED